MTDEQLVEMLQNPVQRNTAFRTLVEIYQERIYWHVRKIVIVHEDADDVVQNVFVKIFKNIENFQGDSKLFTWIYRIATNESLSHLQKQKKHKNQTELDASINYMEHLSSDEYFDGDDITKQLILAIGQLPEKQRLVFQLRYFEDLTYKDISEILDTSEGALKASFHHATNKIKEIIKNVAYLL